MPPPQQPQQQQQLTTQAQPASPRANANGNGNGNGTNVSPRAGKSSKVRVGYGVGAWIRSSALNPIRRTSRVPTSHFALLARLPVIKEGRLIRIGNWSAGFLRDQEVYVVVKSCLALVYHGETRGGGPSLLRTPTAPRRKSLGAIPTSQEFVIPDRVLVLAGGSVARLAQREDVQITCQDGTVVQLRAPDGHARDAWVAALDRAVRQGSTRLSDFESYAKLARGHFGTVQLVKHVRTNTALALKQIEMRPKKPEKQFHERHILELLQSGSTGACPFIARLCFAFRDSKSLYLATELASGGDLWALLRKCGKLAEPTARFVVAEVVLGVRHVHSHGVLHRDIKLENLLLDGSGNIKMVDFGLSKRLFDPSAGLWDGRTYTVCGTNYYMPPEMLKKSEGNGHGLPADWWQVGCLLYELIVGTPAFFEKGARAIHKKILDTGGAPPFPRGIEPSLACIDMVSRTLVHDPTRRLGHGREDGRHDIMDHKFFSGLDWDMLLRRRVEVPSEIRAYLRGDSSSGSAGGGGGGGSGGSTLQPHHLSSKKISSSTSPPPQIPEGKTITPQQNGSGVNGNGFATFGGGGGGRLGRTSTEGGHEHANGDGAGGGGEEAPITFFTGREDEEDLVQRMFPESELYARPERGSTLRNSSKHGSTRIKSMPSLPRLSSLSNMAIPLTAGAAAQILENSPYLGYEYACDDEALGDARRGSGLILSRWTTTAPPSPSGG